jgi:hypothetical protein
MSGIGSTKMNQLIREGRVHSVLLDGKRLVDLEDLANLDQVAARLPAPAGSVPMLKAGPGRPKKIAPEAASAASGRVASIKVDGKRLISVESIRMLGQSA